MLDLDPKYRQVSMALADAFRYGDIVPYEWLYRQFGFSVPEDGCKFSEFQEFQLTKMTAFHGLVEECLSEHKLLLVCVRTVGYRVAHPKEHTAIAMDGLSKALHKGFKVATKRLINSKDDMLNQDDKRKRDDAIGKLGALACFAKVRKLTELDEE